MNGGEKLVGALAVLSAAGLAAVAAPGNVGAGVTHATSAGAPGTTVRSIKVKLADLKLIPATKRVLVGEEDDVATVTFVVRNSGSMPHEFVVLRTATASAKLVVKGNKAVEKRRLFRISAFDPGETTKVTLTLRAGHYLLLCNLPGHYRAGQFSDFTVVGVGGQGGAGDGTGGGEEG